jgi:hypothetical protein
MTWNPKLKFFMPSLIYKFKAVWLVILLLPFDASVHAKEINGFKLNDALIPPSQIFSGGPGKDGIPAIDNPKFVIVRDADFLDDNDRVLGITIDGVSKVYPIKILNWHEVVNDSIGDISFTVTYCPLCGTGVAFSSKVNGRTLNFGVSGLLYNSDVLLYDRETESLWSQLLNKAVTGEYKGTVLTMLPVLHTTWAGWKRYHPTSQVLSKNTGYWRAYTQDPYAGYETSKKLYFPVFNKAPANYHPKERILGLAVDGKYKAYPFIELNKNNKNIFEDRVNGKRFSIHWNKKQQSGYLLDDDGKMIPIVQSYWFAWYAFHPETDIFKVK